MPSNYKRLGKYIRPVNIRNTNLNVTKLLGVSIQKILMPSIANTVGTDMTTYKVIKKNQFAYGSVTSRNGDKISIALLEEYEEAIVSQAYTVFEIIDETKLNTEYLMMWLRRPEFDRYARFKSHGSARETFDWDEMLDTELPIPSIEKQLEIVKEYNTIVNRIKLNEQLNQKLEETAQAIYKHWFVDFEFPISEEDIERSRNALAPSSIGKPYKSSGGEMVFNEELEKEIPEGWECDNIGRNIIYNYASYAKNDAFSTIEYLDTSSITNNKIEELQTLTINIDVIPSRAKRKVTHNDIIYSTVRPNLKHFGIIKEPKDNMLVSTGFMVIQSKVKDISNELIYMWLTNKEIIDYFQSKAEMSVSTYPSIKPEDILNVNIAKPVELTILHGVSGILSPIFEQQWLKNKENNTLEKSRVLILSKMSKL